MTGINSLVYVASTIPPYVISYADCPRPAKAAQSWYLVDNWGRRFILLNGSWVMGVALTLIGWFMYVDASYTPTAVVVSVIVYNAAFGASWGPIPW